MKVTKHAIWLLLLLLLPLLARLADLALLVERKQPVRQAQKPLCFGQPFHCAQVLLRSLLNRFQVCVSLEALRFSG